MNRQLSRVIHDLVPPLLIRMLRRSVPEIPQNFIWNGIYDHFHAVPPMGDGFSSVEWTKQTEHYTRLVIESHKPLIPIPTGVAGENHLLPLVSALASEGKPELRVLDFGGGMGVAYVHLRKSLPMRIALNYLVVESMPVCERGRDVFRDDAQIQFLPTIPEDYGEIDLVYASGAIQYAADYKSVMAQLCSYRPKHILLVKLSAGDIPTYVSGQLNVSGSIVPCWFLNINDFVGLMKGLGEPPPIFLDTNLGLNRV